MSIELRVITIILSLCFLLFVGIMIRRRRILLKYSLLWMLLGVLGVLAAVFPGWIFALSSLFGFEKASNFLFAACIVFLMVLSLRLCAVNSRQHLRIKELVQTTSLLEKRIRALEEDDLAVEDEVPAGHEGHGEQLRGE